MAKTSDKKENKNQCKVDLTLNYKKHGFQYKKIKEFVNEQIAHVES